MADCRRAPALHPGRRLHDDAVRGQPGRGRARRRRPHDERDAAVRELDEPVRDDVRAAADRPGRRLPGAHLHARAASCRSPATRRSAPATPGCEAGGTPQARRRDRAGVRRRPRAGAADGRRAGVRGAAAAALRPGRRGRSSTRSRDVLRHRARRRSSTPSWADNGPGWIAVLLAERRGRCSPSGRASIDLDIGVVGPVSGRLARGASRCARSSRRTARPSRTR